jgi:hypothetical protein
MRKFLFCDAKIRPECLMKNNLCCLACQKVIECTALNKKTKPCLEKHFDEDEICEFSI